MRLLIIRHGESEADILEVHEGRADFPLTERGHRQADAMAEYVASMYKPTKIYCSTLTRARQTAAHLTQKTGVPAVEDELLMEFNNGLLAGLPYKEATEKYPPVQGLPLHKAVYGQESMIEFRYRTENALSKIITENPEDAVVVVVTHGGTISRLYQSFLRLPINSDIYFATGDTGIHEWSVNRKARTVIRANYCAHTDGI